MALDIHFIDVGQGDATYLRYDSPDGLPRHILVDGGAPARGPEVVDYLRHQGVGKLHLVVATHVDDDHIGGLLDVVANFPVERFWGPDPNRHTALVPLSLAADASAPSSAAASDDLAIVTESVNTYAQLHALALGKGVRIEYPETGDSAGDLLPGLELTSMNPLSGSQETRGVISETGEADEIGILSEQTNNASIVLRVGIAGHFVVLPGDAELSAWRHMIEEWGQGLQADVLKLSHHGSSNGTDRRILDAVKPQQAVISVGPNSYHHPSAEVLALLPPVQIHRTDQEGSIVIRFGEPTSAPPVPSSWWDRLLAFLFRR